MTEKEAILAALREANGNVGRAAKFLGIHRRTLQKRMREHQIPEGKRGRPRKVVAYTKKAARFAAVALPAAVLVGGAVLLTKGRKA